MTYKPTVDEVRTLAAAGNLIPIYRELPADLETPVSVYLKLRQHRNGPGFLLESVEKGEQLGRYSFIGVHPPLSVVAYGDDVTIGGAGGAILNQTTGDPMALVQEMMAARTPVALPDLPRFSGGVCGYWGYDLVRFVEKLPATAERVLDVPDMVMLFSDNLIVFDHVRHKLIVIANLRVNGEHGDNDLLAAYADAVARIDAIIDDLRRPLVPPEAVDCYHSAPWESNFTQAEFEDKVLAAKEYIAAGDIFQVVLSQRLMRTTDADPFTIYRALRMLNPSPYMFFLDFAGVAGIRGEPLRVVGSSPEMHVRLENGLASLHPIAGTRWRGGSPEEDQILADELLADPKERAEHVMLVDLARNDLGRVCDYGTVRVKDLMIVERYSHVMHIVSSVEGRLAADKSAYDLMRATFPAGTVSGAPKIRAMQIISELEGTTRGPYAGCVGYFSFNGNLDTCITIRTALLKDGKAYVQAGGGWVNDSTPEGEFQETVNKAKAMLKAVALAESFGKNA